MPSRRVVMLSRTLRAGIVERSAAGAGGGAATAAACFLALHLAVGPGDDVVELRTDGVETGGDGGAGVARVLLQARKAGAGRFLARDEAPPEAVAEADRPDGEEGIEQERDDAIAEITLGAEGFAQCQPHEEGEGDDDADDQHVVRDRHGARLGRRGRGRDADDEVAHAVPRGVAGNGEQHQRSDADQCVAAEDVVDRPLRLLSSTPPVAPAMVRPLR